MMDTSRRVEVQSVDISDYEFISQLYESASKTYSAQRELEQKCEFARKFKDDYMSCADFKSQPANIRALSFTVALANHNQRI